MPDRTQSQLVYSLEDKPPIGHSVVLGFQHVLTMFGATVSVPLLLGPSMGMNAAQIGVLISAVMLCSGLATFLQTTLGSRLPIVQGVSFSFLAAFFAVISEGQRQGWSPGVMMQYIAGAILVGAIFEIVIGFSGLVGFLRKYLSPVVVGPVIMLIGLALFKHGAPKAAAHWPTGMLTIGLVIVFVLFLAPRFRMFRMFPVLLAMTSVVGLCWLLTIAGIYAVAAIAADGTTVAAHPAAIDLGPVKHSAWIRWHPNEIFLPWGTPKFQLGFIVAALAGYLASMIESFGDYHACARMSGGEDPTARQISRGIGCEGIACLLTSLLGGFSSTSYSENIGVVGLTKVGSRFVVQIAAAILVLLGIFGKFGAISAAIPGPVVGGLYCSLFGLIAAVGIQQLSKADLHSDRNLFIAGFSLFMGLSVPAFFDGSTTELYPPGPEPMLAAMPTFLAEIVKSIGNTGMAVAAICGILLDNLVPGSNRERGLEP